MVRNETSFIYINNFVQRMKDIFVTEWKDKIKQNRKLCEYINFKTHFGYEMYIHVDVLKIRKFKSAYCRFRLSCHDL